MPGFLRSSFRLLSVAPLLGLIACSGAPRPTLPTAGTSAIKSSSSSPCDIAKEERAKVPTLVRKGKLNRATRVMAHALDLCPEPDATTLAEALATSAELAVELLDYQAASVHARRLLAMPDVNDALKLRANAAITAAEQGAKKLASYREITPQTRKLVEDANVLANKTDNASLRATRDAYLAAWQAQPSSQAAIGVGLAARKLGDTALAQTFLDRACSLLTIEHRTPLAATPNRGLMARSIEWSSDGRFLALQHGYFETEHNELSLFDEKTGREYLHLFGLGDWNNAVAFSRDGKRLGVKTPTGGFVLDIASGFVVDELPGLSDSVTTTFSPDLERLAATSFEKSFVLDIAEGSQTVILEGLPDEDEEDTETDPTIAPKVMKAVFSPDGRTLAVLLLDERIILQNAKTGRIFRLPGHGSSLMDLHFSRDGKRLVTVTPEHGDVAVWDMLDMKLKKVIKLGASESVIAVAVSADGSLVAATGTSGAFVWDTKTGARRAKLGEFYLPNAMAFSPDDQHLAINCPEGTFCVTNTATGALEKKVDVQNPAISSFSISPDGKNLVVRPTDGTLRLVDLEKGILRKTISIPHDPDNDDEGCVAFSGDGKLVGATGESLRIFDAATGTMVREEKLPYAPTSLAFSPNGSRFAVDAAGGIRVFSLDANQPPRDLMGHTKRVLSLVFSPDGTLLASGSSDNTIRIWDVATGTEKFELSGHTHLVNAVAFSRDGKRLASGSSDSTVRVWDVTTGMSLQTLQLKKSGGLETVESVAFSPDGTLLATAGHDDALRMWDLASGEARPLETAHGDASSAAFMPDGKWLVSSWNNGRLFFQPPAGKGPTFSIQFLAKEDAGFVIDSNGHADLLGQNPCAARAQILCRAGHIGLPFELCEEHALNIGLLAKVLANKTIDDDPAHEDELPHCSR